MRIQDRVTNEQLTEVVLKRFKKVEPATIGHHLHYGFMDPRVKSMLQDVKVVGTAFTVRTSVNDSTMVHKAVSLAEEGDVLIIDRNGDTKHACVGEMVAYAANVKKLAGIIIDGPCTDIQAIRKIGVPVFATGLSPITTKLYGQSGEINTSVQCGGVVVEPGDLIIADDNGVLVLPPNLSYDEILVKAEASEQREPVTKKLLDEGAALSSLTKADELLKEKLCK
ncbi:RraA family protein [Neobacillus mesonae]|uniref:RraA family protein n=1 Tax=Neobacillus mesonae TaxID=1193713 RepID=UPI00203E42A5|nr:RraA family protein [Neobacillus mesonae]MCM3569044.1 RraA family protein [Neobacillus mesonae]